MSRVKHRRDSAASDREQGGGWLGWRSAATVVLWSGLIAATAYGVNLLHPIAERHAARSPARIEWINLPDWLAHPNQREFLENLATSAQLLPEDNAYTPYLAERVGSNLLLSPWIASVRRVAVQSTGLVRVDAEFRKPVALIHKGATAHLVDRHGVRLPWELPVERVDPAEWLVITGVRCGLPLEGQAFSGEDVSAAIRLAEYLLDAEQQGALLCRDKIRAIDMSQFDRKLGRIRLLTTTPDVWIKWGLPVGEEYEIENSAAGKLRYLNYLAQSGQLLTRGALDLTDPREIIALRP